MSSPSQSNEGSGERQSRLTPDIIKRREREVIAMALRMALGYARNVGGAPLFAAEVGVYRGRTLALLAKELESAGVDATIVGFDSFTGLPDLSEKDASLASPLLLQRRNLVFSDTSKREVDAFLEPFGTKTKIELREGMFAHTFKSTPERKYFFVNLSCKLHSSHMMALEYFYPRLAPGAVMLFDDYFDKSYPMARIAVDEFMNDKAEQLCQLHSGDGSSTFRRTFIVKQ